MGKVRFFIKGPRPIKLRKILGLTIQAHRALAAIAEDEQISIQKVIYKALEEYLQKMEDAGMINYQDETKKP